MSAVTCFEPIEAGEGRLSWQPVTAPPLLHVYDGVLVVDLAQAGNGCRVSVNGLPVVGGLQVVERGDVVRVHYARKPDVVYVVGGLLPWTEPGQGRMCQLTGLPITGQAVRCPCGALYGRSVVDQIGDCPRCARSLAGQMPPPPEELL